MPLSDEESRSILGVDVLLTSSPALVSRIDASIEAGTPLRLAFLNANLANKAATNPDLAAKLRSFVVVNDGIGLDIASRLLYGRPFPQNLNGTDFTPFFLDTTRHKLRLFLLGARADVVSRAAQSCAERWPQHEVVGKHDGFFSKGQEKIVAEEIRAARPDIVLAAMGNPRQELWIADHIPDVCRCGFAVGALFDFLTGEMNRAPQWIRSLRCEWAFRLAQEPRRLWRRYLVGNAAFLARVLSQKFRDRR